MKKIGVLFILALTLLWVTAQFALSADSALRPAPKTSLKQTPPVKPSTPTVKPSAAAQMQPMKQTLKLTPAMKMRLNTPQLTMPIHLQEIEQDFSQMSKTAKIYEDGISKMPGIFKECAEKAYTVEDQADAGCTGSDTVDQCREKLVRQCLWVKTFKSGFAQHGGAPSAPNDPGSYALYAKSTAAEARELIKKLERYARQAEQHGATWSKAMEWE